MLSSAKKSVDQVKVESVIRWKTVHRIYDLFFQEREEFIMFEKICVFNEKEIGIKQQQER